MTCHVFLFLFFFFYYFYFYVDPTIQPSRPTNAPTSGPPPVPANHGAETAGMVFVVGAVLIWGGAVGYFMLKDDVLKLLGRAPTPAGGDVTAPPAATYSYAAASTAESGNKYFIYVCISVCVCLCMLSYVQWTKIKCC